MSSRILLFFFAMLILAGMGCKTTPKEPTNKIEDYDPVMKSLLRTDSGLFRGANLGMNLSTVKALEKAMKPDEEENNYLSYGIAFKDTIQCSYYYNFETDGLDEIGINIYRTKAKELDWLFSSLKHYFTKKYGEPRQENNLLVWYVKNQGKEGAEITLGDESKDYSYGELTITIFPFQSEVDPTEKEAKP
ncbi:MAG TPA: hypothetical protein VNZ86_14870 [Bacteroidia bacterium]|jgi:hypothetical protein|nr:hypothetical protein [Bacteroidia bacterium]